MYPDKLIDAAEVVRVMIQIRQDMVAEEQRARVLGLDADELAFYDAVAVNFFGLYDEAFLRDLIHDVVHTVKNNLKVDWTEPHREDVKATVRAAVRRELRKRNVRQEDLEPFLGYVLDQAKEIYADWPLSAYAVKEKD
jgi:type I restriction enzyme, R subunit